MIKLSVSRIAIAAFAVLVIPGLSGALAQSADTRNVQDVEKENAELRARIHRLEVEKENANLRAKLQQLKGQPAPREVVAERTPAPQGAIQRELVNYAGGGDPKAAYAMAAPYYSWTGFYIGGNMGYGVGSDRVSGTVTSAGITDVTAADAPVVPVGAIGGAQLGYNWQGGPNWLAGFEADFQGSAQKGLTCVIECFSLPAVPVSAVFTAQHTLDYFGTIRGRFGFVNNNTLFYVTGGGAYGHISQTLQATVAQAGSGTFASNSTSENKFGFVVGAGLEASLGGNWTGKVEYLYMDLGSTSTALSGTFPGTTPAPFSLALSSTLHDNIVRAGLNYRFGAPGSAYNAMAADLPVKASTPERVYSWSGFYVGGNVGYGFGNDHDLMTETQAATATTNPGSSVTPKGAFGGAQLGYNWQASPHLLAGFEADLQGSAQNDTACGPLACILQPGGTTNFTTVQQQIDYFGTVRGRLGVINGNVLYYATGGAAFGHVTQDVSVNSAPVFVSGSSSADMIGWTVGGGIEAALWGGWTAKAEYLYMDLGSISTSVNATSPGAAPTTLATTSTIRDHIVRIGANYHFDTGPDIIAARY
jgi:outer membrane immunogenic protein